MKIKNEARAGMRYGSPHLKRKRSIKNVSSVSLAPKVTKPSFALKEWYDLESVGLRAFGMEMLTEAYLAIKHLESVGYGAVGLEMLIEAYQALKQYEALNEHEPCPDEVTKTLKIWTMVWDFDKIDAIRKARWEREAN